MILVVGLVVIVVSVPAFGGSFSGIDRTELRAGWLLVATFVAQQAMLAMADGWAPRLIHVASFVLAGCFVALNWRLRGARWVAAGGALNVAAVVANRGVMPAWRWAWSASGAPHLAAGAFANARPLVGAKLLVLGDIVPFPRFVPGAAPFSIGDVVVLVGLAFTIHHLCGTRWTRHRGERADTRPVAVAAP